MRGATPDPLTELLTEHLAWLAARGYAEHTVDARRRYLLRFLGWLEDHGVTLPGQVALPVLERYRLQLFERRKSDGTPLGWGTQTQELLAVKGLFKWLTLTRRIAANPAAELELPPKRHPIPRGVLTAEETECVLAQPDTTRDMGVRDRAILELLYSTGLRRAECCHLQLHDVELGRLVVLVREGKGGRDRMVPLGERAAGWLERWLTLRGRYVVEPDAGWLFLGKRGRPIRPDRLSTLVRTYIERAGLGKTGSCHLLRHTMATLMLEGGADIRHIQMILGHAELSTTALYTRVSIHQLQEVHKRTHPARLRRTERDHHRLLSSLAAELLDADNDGEP